VSPGTPPSPQATLPMLAVLHQWMGSGTQQRGLSLTSTKREHATFGNEGKPFREGSGVRIKIDLFKVPTDVILLNHYSAGGVKDDLSTINPGLRFGEGGTRPKYAYFKSVIKNRELFLERLDPAWVVDVETHGVQRVQGNSNSPGPDPVGAAKAPLKYDEYTRGFGAAVRAIWTGGASPFVTENPEPGFERGLRAGTTYMDGYKRGADELSQFTQAVGAAKTALTAKYDEGAKEAGARLAAATGKASELRNKAKAESPATRLGTNLVCDMLAREKKIVAVNAIVPTPWLALTALADDEKHFDLYWVGWSHSARGEDPHDTLGPGFY
jgi:hypothetical protein